MSANSDELEALVLQLNTQNSLIEALEKELNDLTVKSDQNNNDDANAQMVKKLKLENDKLNYRIGILERSIEEANSSSAKIPTNQTLVQSN